MPSVSAVPASPHSNVAAAGAWGVLRNMLQEFPGFKWVGADHGAAAASGDAAVPASTDAFGAAADGEADQCCRHICASPRHHGRCHHQHRKR